MLAIAHAQTPCGKRSSFLQFFTKLSNWPIGALWNDIRYHLSSRSAFSFRPLEWLVDIRENLTSPTAPRHHRFASQHENYSPKMLRGSGFTKIKSNHVDSFRPWKLRRRSVKNTTMFRKPPTSQLLNKGLRTSREHSCGWKWLGKVRLNELWRLIFTISSWHDENLQALFTTRSCHGRS